MCRSAYVDFKESASAEFRREFLSNYRCYIQMSRMAQYLPHIGLLIAVFLGALYEGLLRDNMDLKYANAINFTIIASSACFSLVAGIVKMIAKTQEKTVDYYLARYSQYFETAPQLEASSTLFNSTAAHTNGLKLRYHHS
jgi:hypothetical protein